MHQHLIELIRFSTYAELRAERERSYLGLIWWVAEPAMMMGAFWLVFDLILKTGGPDYVPFLLVGLTLWQWMKSCITHGGYSIWGNLGLIRQVRIPVLVFPLVQIFADTIKFLYIFALLLVILWLAGFPPNITYLALPVVFVVTLLFSAGGGFLMSAVIPLIPDLRFVIEQILTMVMFLSGVVFALDAVPPPLRDWFALNPVVTLLDATRGILMHGQWPDWIALLKVTLVSLVVLVIGIGVVLRLAPRYPKLAA
ncbi:MAG: ABC transporter permease [Xanthomonadales bacterium]|mgnify:FL=1|uniref:ABC transporter permease n=1 Tax=Dokdonella sp. TaxID=2291710 RepID=UPI002B6AF91F|nr:ABC transporter permease [Xanthomonadales bacterium]HQV71619.1 ABC transporter permease [Dokdonella sp.]MBK7012134.1 ABC transporter permease [Xanthomonadales bacterium]MBK7209795.1 ABC transporter permease [Xanthomonadales bacterium]MBL0222453.1 ABC transporter permease [Xanthomonadales bacterium]